MNTAWLDKWQTSLQDNSNPFVSHGFLTAMECSGACTANTGWTPRHLSLGEMQIPMYEKTHSWGEYVFDWSWSSAYQQHGLSYYPKLLIAAPYTPSQGPRLLGAKNQHDVQQLTAHLKDVCLSEHFSGFHILFPEAKEQDWLDQLDLLKRSDVQFHWNNKGYRDFDDFLDVFASRKRKNVRKERKSITDQGIDMRLLAGAEIDDQSWQDFYHFYHATYLKRGRHGYLNKAFFDAIRHSMSDQIVLIMARRENQNIAGALCFQDNEKLYGRYWGCIEEFNNLHFEACYYQGIDYCIQQGLKTFDPGTQGEHKIARGFEPTITHSYHWLSHPQFFQAAKNFCREEAMITEHYFQQATEALPFKQEPASRPQTKSGDTR